METRFSNCCGARPYSELDVYRETKDVKHLGLVTREYYFGRCNDCMENAEFFTDEEYDNQDKSDAEWRNLKGELVGPNR